MKFLFLSILTSLSMSVASHAAPLLDADEQYELLRSIDSICGDTWCEGDSNYSFDAIQCDSEAGCVLSLTMKPYEYEDENSLPERQLSCDLYTFTKRDSLVEVTNRGLQYTPELYEAITDCIERLNDEVGPMWVPVDSSCRSLFPSEGFLPVTIELKDDIDGLDAALWSITRLVRNQAKVDDSCKLETIPMYRDKANCKFNAKTETCSLPTVEGWFRVRTTLKTGISEVRYYPKKVSDSL